MNERILVTGSQGFVGRHLRSLLAARGVQVIGADRPGLGGELDLDLADEAFSPKELAARVGPVSGIIHLAARITRGSSVDLAARKNLRAIAESAVGLMEAFSERHGATHLVFCSSIKVYGPQTRQPIAPDTSPLHPESRSYGSAKALAERLLEISCARGLGSCAIVRPSYVYGPGQPATTAIPMFLRACLAGKAPVVFGNGSQLRDDVLVGDVAYCLAEACLRRAEGTFNAAGERARTLLEVADLCCQAVERCGGPGSLTPVLNAERAPAPWIDQAFDISRTRSLLDYQPVSMMDGLEREARWILAGAEPERARDYTFSGGAS